MENKLPHDRLEEFLQKSLEGFSPTPPHDMWSKITHEMDATAGTPPAKTTVVRPLRQWWAVAAAVALLTIVVAQQLYFQHKVNTLSQQVQQLAQQDKSGTALSAEPRQTYSSDNGPSTVDGSSYALPPAPPSEAFQQQTASTSASKEVRGTNRAKEHFTQTSESQSVKNPLVENPLESLNQTVFTENHLREAGPGELAPLPGFTQQKQNEQRTSAMQAPLLETVALADGLQRTGFLQTTAGLNFVPVTPMTQVARKPWTLGATTSWMTTRINQMNEPLDDDGQGPDQPWQDRRHQFADAEEISAKTQVVGLNLDYYINNHWAIGSGLSLLRTELTTKHTSDFEVRDRDHHGGSGPHHPPGGNHNHDFEYDLQTATGLASISLRVSEVDTMRQLDDDERVSFSIATRQNITRLAFPLTVAYRVDMPRWSIRPKVGVLANFTTSRELAVTDARISHDTGIFQPSVMPIAGLDDHLTFGLDAIAALGISYRLTPSFELGLEPSAIQSIGSWSVDSSDTAFSWGVGAYAAYRF